MVRTRSKAGHEKKGLEDLKAVEREKRVTEEKKKGKKQVAIMAQAEIPQKISYSDEFMQVSKTMEIMNRTLAEMNKGLTSRLDGLTERMDRTEINSKLEHENAESDRKLANSKN